MPSSSATSANDGYLIPKMASTVKERFAQYSNVTYYEMDCICGWFVDDRCAQYSNATYYEMDWICGWYVDDRCAQYSNATYYEMD